MSAVNSILPIDGVPEELIRALNDRFRQLSAATPSSVDGSAAGLIFNHAARASANLTSLGTYGTEVDRGVIYQVQLRGSSKLWIYAAGTMADTAANRPADLGTNDAGFLFLATDTLQASRWSGSAWVDYSGGGLSSQSVVTGSRALGTVYQNTGTVPMFVLVTLRCTAGGGANFGQADAKTDAANPPTTVVVNTFNGSAVASIDQQLGFWVLPGNYYKVQLATTVVSLICWTEWQ